MIEAILVIAILIIDLFIVFVLPSSFRFHHTHSIIITAPPSQVFALVNNFQKWRLWNPWTTLDPLAQNIFSTPSAGKNALFSWAGNTKVGTGTMLITESIPNELILIRLEFIKPFKVTSTTEFTFTAEGDYTRINWSMVGPVNFIGKLISTFTNCNTMTSDILQQGLKNMKTIIEAQNA